MASSGGHEGGFRAAAAANAAVLHEYLNTFDLDLLDDTSSWHGRFGSEELESQFVMFSYRGGFTSLSYALAASAFVIIVTAGVGRLFESVLGWVFFGISMALIVLAVVNLALCWTNLLKLSLFSRCVVCERLGVAGTMCLMLVALLSDSVLKDCFDEQRPLTGGGAPRKNVTNFTEPEYLKLRQCDRVIFPYPIAALAVIVFFVAKRAHVAVIGAIGSVCLYALGRSISQHDEAHVFWIRWGYNMAFSGVMIAVSIRIDKRERERFATYMRSRVLSVRTKALRDTLDDTLKLLLPVEIVQALAQGETVLDVSNNVTIGVCDVHDFIKWSTSMLPRAAMLMMNAAVSLFDVEVTKLGLLKIKVLGDRYIAGSRLRAEAVRNENGTAGDVDVADLGGDLAEEEVRHQNNDCNTRPVQFEAHGVILLAAFQHQVARTLNAYADGSLGFCVAIHTGQCFGSVLGVKSVSYEVFGEAVSVTSALAGSVPEGYIAVSSHTLSREQQLHRLPAFAIDGNNERDADRMINIETLAGSLEAIIVDPADAARQVHRQLMEYMYSDVPPGGLDGTGNTFALSSESFSMREGAVPSNSPGGASGSVLTTKMSPPLQLTSPTNDSLEESVFVNTLRQHRQRFAPNDAAPITISGEPKPTPQSATELLMSTLKSPEAASFAITLSDTYPDLDGTASRSRRPLPPPSALDIESSSNGNGGGITSPHTGTTTEFEFDPAEAPRALRRQLLRDRVHAEVPSAENEPYVQHIMEAASATLCPQPDSEQQSTSDEKPPDPEVDAVARVSMQLLRSRQSDANCFNRNVFASPDVEHAFTMWAGGYRNESSSSTSFLCVAVALIVVAGVGVEALSEGGSNFDFDVRPSGMVLVCAVAVISLLRGLLLRRLPPANTPPPAESATGLVLASLLVVGVGLLGKTMASSNLQFLCVILIPVIPWLEPRLRFYTAGTLASVCIIAPFVLVRIFTVNALISDYVTMFGVMLLAFRILKSREDDDRTLFVDACVAGIELRAASHTLATHRGVIEMLFPAEIVDDAVTVCTSLRTTTPTMYLARIPRAVVVSVNVFSMLRPLASQSPKDAHRAIERLYHSVEKFADKFSTLSMVGGFGDTLLFVGPLANSRVVEVQPNVKQQQQQQQQRSTTSQMHSSVSIRANASQQHSPSVAGGGGGKRPSLPSHSNSNSSTSGMGGMNTKNNSTVGSTGSVTAFSIPEEVPLARANLSALGGTDEAEPAERQTEREKLLHQTMKDALGLMCSLERRCGGALSAVGVLESAVCSITGQTAPTFAVAGVAVRQAGALLAAATEGFLGVSDGFAREMRAAGISEGSLNPPEVWAVRGVGRVSVHPISSDGVSDLGLVEELPTGSYSTTSGSRSRVSAGLSGTREHREQHDDLVPIHPSL